MSWDSETEIRPANTIVEAGEILQKLTPARLATLLFVTDDEIETQTEMADSLDISSSTITTYLQTFANLPVPLTVRGNQYTITSAGDTVIGFLARMTNRLGVDLRDIDWEDETNREQIGELLAPIHTTQTIVPFFILYSIGQRSTVEGRIGIFAPSQSVRVKDIVSDVDYWQEERGKTATRKQVRSILGRFEDFEGIEIDGKEVMLKDKGKEQAKLLEQLIELIEDSQATEASETPSSSTQQDSTPMNTRPATATATDSTGISPQLGLQRFYRQESVGDSEELSTIVPAYGLSAATSEREGYSQPQAVLPLMPTVTVAELSDQLNRIGREHGDDTQLELVWTELMMDTDPNVDRSNDCTQPQR